MIIERNRSDERTPGILFQDSMNFAKRNSGIRQMLQDFGHHYRIEAFISKTDPGGEIHFRTGDPLARGFHRGWINVHADPANESHHFGQDSTTTSHIQSQILAVVTIYLQPSSIERSFDLFMLRADRCVEGGASRISLVKLLNQAAPAVWLV